MMVSAWYGRVVTVVRGLALLRSAARAGGPAVPAGTGSIRGGRPVIRKIGDHAVVVGASMGGCWRPGCWPMPTSG